MQDPRLSIVVLAFKEGFIAHGNVQRLVDLITGQGCLTGWEVNLHLTLTQLRCESLGNL